MPVEVYFAGCLYDPVQPRFWFAGLCLNQSSAAYSYDHPHHPEKNV